MSQSDDNLSPEVAERWRPLHEDMQARHEELPPPRRRALPVATVVAVVAVFLCVLTLLGVAWQKFVLEPTAQAAANTATAQAAAANTATAAAATANTATAVAKETLTAQTQIANAQATATAEQLASEGTQTAVVEAAATREVKSTQTAESQRCLDVRLYGVKIDGKARLLPEPGTVEVIGEQEPESKASATWRITNEGECIWYEVNLYTRSTSETITPQLFRQGNLADQVEPGESVELTITFPITEAESIEKEWIFILNGLQLETLPLQSLFLKVDPWIILGDASNQ